MTMKQEKNRREFLKSVCGAIAILPVGAVAVSAFAADKKDAKKDAKKDVKEATPAAKPAAEAAKADYVAESDPGAKALQYVEDVSKATKRNVDKMGVKATDQFCNNCQFYTKADEAGGKCLMIPAGKVRAKGWCASWTKKA